MAKIWVKILSYRATFEQDEVVYNYPEPFQVEDSEKVRAALKCNILQRVPEEDQPKTADSVNAAESQTGTPKKAKAGANQNQPAENQGSNSDGKQEG